MATTVIRLALKVDLIIETEGGRPDREDLIAQIMETVADELPNLPIDGGDVDNANPEGETLEWSVTSIDVRDVSARSR